ncbi:MAG: DUF1800 domain-containing protein [Bacteroidetes bacterium]|nr:DUF1800 domain-containing protein [Bacteroidota bacterium]MBU1371717.1 DUF1800 domain-containing protein [Bacteroidota bacterium]MBU1483722.1 DUF1800 domain-containing protein [Bacteroidota bacterium]MBU1761206.1 DUF1800 domain-containing protein [Bacteroidota bacterium]MBU2268065.1 DUF1800 domain-containing protein [Bacteroidota bacterium]
MKALLKFFYLPVVLLALTFTLCSSFLMNEKEKMAFPYKASGLTERQAATHLLNRFTYGPKPGDVDAVIKIGLEKWFQQQLNGNLPDDSLKSILSQFDAIKLSNAQANETFPKAASVLRMAIKEGYIDKDSVNKGDKKDYREKLGAYIHDKGIQPPKELFRQFISQKIYRAAYSNNQLQEVLTDFWFNHFNVSITKNQCAIYIPAYERDIIRPNALGKFSDLLLATAKSPAMLFYLDNFSSSGTNEQMNPQINEALMNNIKDPNKKEALRKLQANKKNQGLNENYAREVMELHTLGVDGGYTQTDVTQAAKVLTGWTVYPIDENGPGAGYKKVIERIGENKLAERGFVHEGDFMFAPNRHDTSEKSVLGKHFALNGGYQEGVDLLEMLAHHPSTAKFISKKLAVRFVSDNPPQSLIDKMAKTFLDKNGDIKQILITMVNAPEFWSKEALTEKTKSPFELAISSLRALDATITQPYQVYNWLDKMGQKMYFYQAPTGFPDKGQYWINTGALLNRMNFGLALTANKIPGIKVDLAALNRHHEPESSSAALLTYGKLIMPERDLSKSIDRLTPMLNDPELANKIGQAADKATPRATMDNSDSDMMMGQAPIPNSSKMNRKKANSFGDNTMLAQVVGVIIGSPEFQRR